MNYDKLLLSTLSQDAFYLVNKKLVTKLGVTPSLTLSLLIDKYKYFEKENKLDSQKGFFLSAKKTKKQINIIEQELKIARSARRSAFDILKKNDLVKIIKKGNPAQYHYYLNFEKILIIISSEEKESLPSEVKSSLLSEVDSNLSSEVKSSPLYNKNKEQKQITKSNTNEPENIETLPRYLKNLANELKLTYCTNPDEERLFHNKLMKLNFTNDRIKEQAARFAEIVKRDPKCFWVHSDSFGFKFLQFNWGKIDAWHNANKPKTNVVKFERTEKEKPVFDSSAIEKMAGFLK